MPTSVERVQAILASQQAHQLTLTGTTFPFVDRLHFAATLDPRKRKYSLYAGLWLMRPDDLLFFYQSAPQIEGVAAYTRAEMTRGIRGIYKIAGEWQRHATPIPCPIGRATYPLYGACPTCANAGVTSYEVDPQPLRGLVCTHCGHPAPNGDARDGGPPRPGLILGLVCPIEPFIVFRNTVPQAIAYGDRTHRPMLWTGRHDNAMGAGKGSTSRHLLPEEAIKLTELLESENSGGPTATAGSCALQLTSALDANGRPLSQPRLRTKAGRFIMDGNELAINAEQSRQIRDPQSELRRILDAAARGLRFQTAVSELPVGYTSSSPDFVVIYADDKGTHRFVVVFENKLEALNLEAAGQLHNYIPWVAQMLANEGTVRGITILPVLCGVRRAGDLLMVGRYSFVLPAFGTQINVESMKVWEYVPAAPPVRFGTADYTGSLSWTDVTGLCAGPRRLPASRLLPCTVEDSRETGRLIAAAPV